MNLHIIDIRYPDHFGHEFMYTNAVYDAAKNRGINSIIYGAKKIEDPLSRNVVALFSELPRVSKKSQNLLNLILDSLSENIFLYKKLNLILSENISSQDIFLFHSPNYRHMPAIYFWWNSIGNKPFLVLILRYSQLTKENGFLWTKKKHYSNLFKLWLVKRFEKNAYRKKIILATDSKILADEFKNMWKIHLITLPIPIPEATYEENSDVNDGKYYNNDPLRLVSLGPARDDKGSYLLEDAIKRVLDVWDGDRLEFIIQTKVSDKGSDRTKKTISNLEKIEPVVISIKESLSTEEYWSYLRMADIVLLPYDAQEYRARTSGIFAEAMALGKHVVVSGETWMENEVRGMDVGITIFKSGSAESFSQGILEALKFIEKKQRNIVSNQEWKKKHNADAYVEILLKGCME